MSFQTCMHLMQKTEEDIFKNADNQTGLVPIFFVRIMEVNGTV